MNIRLEPTVSERQLSGEDFLEINILPPVDDSVLPVESPRVGASPKNDTIKIQSPRFFGLHQTSAARSPTVDETLIRLQTELATARCQKTAGRTQFRMVNQQLSQSYLFIQSISELSLTQNRYGNIRSELDDITEYLNKFQKILEMPKNTRIMSIFSTATTTMVGYACDKGRGGAIGLLAGMILVYATHHGLNYFKSEIKNQKMHIENMYDLLDSLAKIHTSIISLRKEIALLGTYQEENKEDTAMLRSAM